MIQKTFTFKIIGAFLLILVGVFLGNYLFPNNTAESFYNLSAEEMHDEIISHRDYAIRHAKENGDYRCCIEPPCTMCYMEANEWNNHEAGTCACDDLIAEGKEPCPQCKRGLCSSDHSEGDNSGVCEFP